MLSALEFSLLGPLKLARVCFSRAPPGTTPDLPTRIIPTVLRFLDSKFPGHYYLRI